MSRIDDLVKRLCPDGVEYRPLGEVGTFLRGSGLQKKDLVAEGAPAIHYGQIHTHYGVWTEDAVSRVEPELATRLRKALPGDLLIATTSEDDEAVAKAVAWLGSSPVAISGDSFVFHHELDPKYVSYCFQSRGFQDQKRNRITGTKVRRISASALSGILIPVPPLEVQTEIVRILDCFISLEVELEAELEARKEQFEHFRHRALQFSDTVPVFRLCDIASISTGARPVDMHSQKAGSIPYFNGGVEASGWVDDGNCRSDAITIPSRGSVGIVRYQGDPFWCGPLCYQIRSASASLRTKFLFFWLKEIQPSIVALQQTGSIPALNKKQLATVMVPVPSLETQDKVIHSLNGLETLISSPEIGIQAEIESRRQQYEYYRDRLFAFEEKVS